MDKKHVAILCGAKSYEHEVSVITGIQVAEALDKNKFTFSFIYFDKDNNAWLIKNFSKRSDFKTQKRIPVDIVKRDDKVVLALSSLFSKPIPVDVFYLAFHGGSGESGPVQGQLDLLGAAYTSPGLEGSVIAMNKSLTKEVLRQYDIPTLSSISINSIDYKTSSETVLKQIQAQFSFPVIIKPAHLGSSIAIEIAHHEVELEKFLNVATRLDREILIEPALQDFTEYNVSVRSHGDNVELSPIEEPKREGELLSFSDKYAGGGKKTGQKGSGGMELLDRTVPAKIEKDLASEINALAKAVYKATRLSGLVRIDFMYSDKQLYCTEINPIPGSMSFYLWEAQAEQFTEQISKSIDDALIRFANKIDIQPYKTDIVDKFIS